MANFQPSAKFPQGFDVANYSLSLPPDNARYVTQVGGGPDGSALTVVALTTAKTPSTLVKIHEEDVKSGDPANPDPDDRSHVRRFRVFALSSGEAMLHAQVVGGGDYSNPLAIHITADRGDARVMKRAFQASRDTLRHANRRLLALILQLQLTAPKGKALPPDEMATYQIAEKWLKIKPYKQFDTAQLQLARGVVTRASSLLAQNAALRVDDIMRTPEGVYGRAPVGDATLGMECGETFFTHGPNCQRDVITHEFFHMVGVGHGECKGQPIPPYADRVIVVTPDLALNSADNLSQMICELNGGTCDACTRSND